MPKRKLGLYFFLVFLAIALGGCGFTSVGDQVRDELVTEGQDAANAGLQNLEYLFCNAPTIGAVRRRYGRHPDLAEAYSTICGQNQSEVISTDAS